MPSDFKATSGDTVTTQRSEPAASPEFQALTMTRVLRQNLWLILGAAFAGALLALVFSKLTPKIYSSTVTMEVSRLSDTPLGTSTLNGTPQEFSSSEAMNASLLTTVAELQSASVAFAVMDQLHLNQYPPYQSVGSGQSAPPSATAARERMLKLFTAHLKVALVKDTKLVQVTFSDPDPERAALVANTLIETYLRSDTTVRSAAATQSAQGLTQQLADLRRQVLAAEQRVTDYKQQTGILGAPETTGAGVPSADEAATDRLVELNRALTAAEVNLVQKGAIARATRSAGPDAVLDLSTGALGMSTDGVNPLASERADLTLLASLRQQRSQLAVTQASRAGFFGSRSVQMQQLDSQLNEIDGQIGHELAQIRSIAESDYRIAQADAAGLRQLVEQQQQTVTRMSVGGNQLLVLEQEASSDRKLYQDLFARLEEANVAASVKSSNVTVVDPARASVTPSSPKTAQNVATGLVAGVLLGVFLAFLLDYLRPPEPAVPIAAMSAWQPESEQPVHTGAREGARTW